MWSWRCMVFSFLPQYPYMKSNPPLSPTLDEILKFESLILFFLTLAWSNCTEASAVTKVKQKRNQAPYGFSSYWLQDCFDYTNISNMTKHRNQKTTQETKKKNLSLYYISKETDKPIINCWKRLHWLNKLFKPSSGCDNSRMNFKLCSSLIYYNGLEKYPQALYCTTGTDQ